MTKQATLSPPSVKKKGHVQEIDTVIGQRIHALRKRYKLTQADLAGKLDVSTQQVQKYEKGENRLSLSKAVDLCRALDVSIEKFTDGLYQSLEMGLADNAQQSGFEDNEDIQSIKDTTELIKAYHMIDDPEKRADFIKTVKQMAKALSK
ncbi:MAG: helix-turn-helix transcriptional regulator [Pseudomonadota bacterium]